jgi:hypothetical protein
MNVGFLNDIFILFDSFGELLIAGEVERPPEIFVRVPDGQQNIVVSRTLISGMGLPAASGSPPTHSYHRTTPRWPYPAWRPQAPAHGSTQIINPGFTG